MGVIYNNIIIYLLLLSLPLQMAHPHVGALNLSGLVEGGGLGVPSSTATNDPVLLSPRMVNIKLGSWTIRAKLREDNGLDIEGSDALRKDNHTFIESFPSHTTSLEQFQSERKKSLNEVRLYFLFYLF